MPVRPPVAVYADDLHDAFCCFRARCVPDRAARRRSSSPALILLMPSAIARWRSSLACEYVSAAGVVEWPMHSVSPLTRSLLSGLQPPRPGCLRAVACDRLRRAQVRRALARIRRLQGRWARPGFLYMSKPAG